MEELALHILDVAENSITAGARHIEIQIVENRESDLLKIEIIDDGKGMSHETVQKATDPFFTGQATKRLGLGLPLLNHAARTANGSMEIRSVPEQGTHISALFQLSHIDRQPLGKIADTITALIARDPNVEIKYVYVRNGYKFIFETKEVKEKLAGVAINTSSALAFIRHYIEENTEFTP